MGIEFDDQNVDVGNVEDRRGIGGGTLAMGGGAGLVGLVIFLVVTLLGGDPQALKLPAGQGGGGAGGQIDGESIEQLRQRCNRPGALTSYTDCRVIKAFNVADTVWRTEFTRRSLTYQSPTFVLFSARVATGCGPAQADVGPFYCPADQKIYFELDFLQSLQERFGATGEFAQAYVVAHEFGHHLQTLLGTEPKVRALQQRDPSRANAYSVALELQADCYAGVWTRLADATDRNGIALSDQNIAEALRAAKAVGDDSIQQRSSGRIDQESWTHGSGAQRQQWFTTGARTGDIEACTTFG